MKIYKCKCYIPAIPYPAEWIVSVTDKSKALQKAVNEIKKHSLLTKVIRHWKKEAEIIEILSEKEVSFNDQN